MSPPTHDQEIIRPAFPSIPNPPPTHLCYNLPFSTSCVNHLASTFHKTNAYIIASRSLASQTPYLKQLESALGAAHAGTWIGLRPHTYWDDLVPIINDMRTKNADILISLGGSSIADGAKAVAYALANGVKSVDEMRQIIKKTPDDEARGDGILQRDGVGNAPTIPLIFIPTSLSGAEYSQYAGGTNSVTHQKDQLAHPGMYASLVILDPQLTVTTPFSVWLQSGVRAVDHCCEAICSSNANPAVDSTAEEGLKHLLPGLLKTKEDPQDLDARLQAQLGANLSMTALAISPHVMMGASHGIGHQLGPLGVGHGHTSCVLLPAAMKYNAARAAEAHTDILMQQAKLKKILWAKPEVKEVLREAGLEEATSDVGDALRTVFNKLGMPASLKDVNVGREKFDMLAENSLNDPFVKTNPVNLDTKEQVLEILEMVAGR